ncbi:hypothetical protein TNCV_2355271 [Trichonephila clavipes]|nr:hypothetical protein TNCV_2355271 [Trichonephila clavipes]
MATKGATPPSPPLFPGGAALTSPLTSECENGATVQERVRGRHLSWHPPLLTTTPHQRERTIGHLTDLTYIAPLQGMSLMILGGLRYPSGQGIGSWQACHEFEPSTPKDPPCRAAMPVKTIES